MVSEPADGATEDTDCAHARLSQCRRRCPQADEGVKHRRYRSAWQQRHPRDEDLSAARFPVLKILGTRDCVAPADDSRANGRNLPPSTEWIEIAGGNHSQFGFYGSQINDCSATISRDEQQKQLTTALVAFLTRISTAAR